MKIYYKGLDLDDLKNDVFWKQEQVVFQEDDNDKGVNQSLWEKSDVLIFGINELQSADVYSDFKAFQQNHALPFIVVDPTRQEINEELRHWAFSIGASDFLNASELKIPIVFRSIQYAQSKYRSHKLFLAERERYTNLFNHSLDPIFLCDHDFNLFDANRSFRDYIGVSMENVVQLNLQELIRDLSVIEKFRKVLKEEAYVRKVEIQIFDQFGEEKKCLLSMTRLKNDTRHEDYFQVMLHDLSEIEEALHDRRMAEKMVLTGKFARMIAHEVRNPLTNINLSAQQLSSELDEHVGLPDEQKENAALYLEIIERNSGRINQLINDMLEISKPRSLVLKKVKMKEVIEESLSLINDRLTLREVDLSISLDEELELNLDQQHLSIALLNIFTNAIEAMEKEEEPLLSISTSINSDEGEVSLLITDNGIGMTPEQLKNLFEPFSTGKSKGLGLGMTTTQNILRDHKAKISVNSKLGKGTSFCLKFKMNTQ